VAIDVAMLCAGSLIKVAIFGIDVAIQCVGIGVDVTIF
jgi:hypothetical protein